MPAQKPQLGRCPLCGAEIATLEATIRYEPPDDQPAMYAECPGCGEIVHPE
ncbi:MAG: hypothetical protein ABEI31_03560 [Halodesulfurarchaeum sp.]